jgi:hypothetical protein
MHRARARNQTGWLGKVARAARMDKDGNAFAREVARASRVIEVHMGHEKTAEVARREPKLLELDAESVERHRASTLDEHGALAPADHERRRRPRDPEVARVEFVHGKAAHRREGIVWARRRHR